MLFEIKFKDQKISLVLNKIAGVTDCNSNGCRVFMENDNDGFACSEQYSVVCARLYAILENMKSENTKF